MPDRFAFLASVPKQRPIGRKCGRFFNRQLSDSGSITNRFPFPLWQISLCYSRCAGPRETGKTDSY